jgi:hypothetical protein
MLRRNETTRDSWVGRDRHRARGARLVLSAAILVAPVTVTAAMEISIRPAAQAPFELLRPAPGEVLESGRPMTVAWRPVRDLAAEGVHEWEAFLSFDGGRHWPVRVTPHLDVKRSSYRVALPLVPSDDVRLMLRFGDEHRETGYVLPIVLRSVVARNGGSIGDLPTPVLAAGETARPGVPGVVVWVDGDRLGSDAEIRAAIWQPPEAREARVAQGLGWTLPAAPLSRTTELAPSARGPMSPTGSARVATANRWTRSVLPLLLLLCRQNE